MRADKSPEVQFIEKEVLIGDSSCPEKLDSLIKVQQELDDAYLSAMQQMLSKYAAMSDDVQSAMHIITEDSTLLEAFITERNLVMNGDSLHLSFDSSHRPLTGYYLRIDPGVDTLFLERKGLNEIYRAYSDRSPLYLDLAFVSSDRAEAIRKLLEMREEIPNLQLIQF